MFEGKLNKEAFFETKSDFEGSNFEKDNIEMKNI